MTVLDRIPQQIDAGCPFAVGGDERVLQMPELGGILERGINQDKSAPLLGRNIRMKSSPAVDRNRLATWVAPEIPRERTRRPRLELASKEPIRPAQEGAREHRRSGIEGQLIGLIESCDGVEIGRKQRLRLSLRGCRNQPRNAVVPFRAAARLRTGKIVEAGACVGVDHPEWRRLGAQMHENPNKDRVLDHIREIPGVERMAVVHGKPPAEAAMVSGFRRSVTSGAEAPAAWPRPKLATSAS